MSWITNYISTNDFNGEYFIPVQDHTRLTDIINAKTESIIKDLLGLELYKIFVSEIEGGSPSQKYIDIRDGVEYVDLSQANVEYLGFKSFLLPFIYSYVLNNNYSLSNVGVIKQLTDNSEIANEYTISRLSRESWNNAVVRYYEASNYIKSKNNAESDYYSDWVFSHKKHNNNIV